METTKNDLYFIFESLVKKYSDCETEINSCLKELKDEHIDRIDFSEAKHIIMQQMNTAQNKFTIATIGEFKAGKSTTLNTILNLRGNAELSCQFQPDTAKAIRIMKKDEDQDYEAEIIFIENSDYTNEKMSWEEAKKYTSQIALDENPQLKRKAEQISEVRYYLDLDILEQCNFLDLPGLGVNPKHDRVTIEKSNECDAVFWIVSNTQEVSKDTMQNLQLIKHKMIPIINVWYNPDTGEEAGDFSFDEMRDSLLDNYRAYLGDNEIMKYCAKAIEIALERISDDEDIEDAFEDNRDDVWGYDAMKERLHDLVYGEGVDLEQEKKNRMVENVLEACADMHQKINGKVSEIRIVEQKLNTEKISNALIKSKITSAYNSNQLELKDVASGAVDKIIRKINEASELFIDAKMASPKLGVVFKTITKNGKKQLAKEYNEEYITKYLEIDKKENGSSWIDAVLNSYQEDLIAIFVNEYAKAGLEFDNENGQNNNEVVLDMKFFDSIGENMGIAFEQQIKEFLPVIISGILLYIPGHEIVDTLFMLSSLTGSQIGKRENKLERRVEQTKRRARLSVSFQRVKLDDKFREMGIRLNDEYKELLIKKLELKKEEVDKLVNATEKIFNVQGNLEEYYIEFKNTLRGCKEGE